VGELYATAFGRCYGVENVCLRYFNIFGPRQDPNSPYSGVLSRFTTAFLNEEQPEVYGDGEQTRDFTYVDNAVQAAFGFGVSIHNILGPRPLGHVVVSIILVIFSGITLWRRSTEHVPSVLMSARPDFWQIFGKLLFEGDCDGRQN
jgi:hypothetical protein